MNEIAQKKAMAGLRVTLNILRKWGCSDEQINVILEIPGLKSNRIDSYLTSIKLSNNELIKISLILNIHASLREIFDNPLNVYEFVNTANDHRMLDGKRPIDLLLSGQVDNFQLVYDFLKKVLQVH